MATALAHLLVQDLLLLALCAAIGTLLLAASVFALLAVMLRRRNQRTAARWAQLEAVWQPLVLDALAGGTALPAVAAADADRFVDYLLRFHQRLRGTEQQRVRELARPHLAAIVRHATTGDPEQRARAVHTLGLLAAEQHVPLLLAALADPAPLVAMTAARSLAHTGDTAHLPALLDAVPRFPLWSTRYLATLLTRARGAAGPLLRTALVDPARPERTRQIVAAALALLHDPGAAACAAQVAADTTAGRELRAAALHLLAVTGTALQAAVPRALLTGADELLRGRAAAALAATGSAADAPALLALLDDPSVWVAAQAARALRQLGGEADLQRLAAAGHPRAALLQAAEEGA